MSKAAEEYMPQLDGLRAVLVLLVAITHWIPDALGTNHWGQFAVRCFFVLSGFLITGILLRSRQECEDGTASATQKLYQFYVRRTLRIFPIYYLTLAIGLIAGTAQVLASLPWHALYLSNVYFTLNGFQGATGHLWSLSVEEQFYLLWPALLLFLPIKRVYMTFWVAILGALVARIGVVAVLGPHHLATRLLLPTCMDTLGMGGLLAFACQKRNARDLLAKIRYGWLPLVALGLPFAYYYTHVNNAMTETIFPIFEGLVSVLLVGFCAGGYPGMLGKVFSFAPLRYLGRISYGFYLYHAFTPHILIALEHRLRLPEFTGLTRFLIMLAFTLASTALSFHFLELPIQKLKGRFAPKTKNKDGAHAASEVVPAAFAFRAD